jgi:hypothetical protein
MTAAVTGKVSHVPAAAGFRVTLLSVRCNRTRSGGRHCYSWGIEGGSQGRGGRGHDMAG